MPPVVKVQGRYHQSLWLRDQLDGATTGVIRASGGPGNGNGQSGGHVNAAEGNVSES